ncbi:leucine--tRNA ligase, mitochondrial isoform X2 [Neocloeon triangulifer]|uniref:leucine--tRNA ligase, mitochondrial isoform X2 n=1 Tax=Neocloeon triangulifer TaxID=2078957 RepID=UPI00286EE50F|nr:leucine--tRNA ligase, mitochondrial isoform X2 [Neocloeon triangulifer]
MSYRILVWWRGLPRRTLYSQTGQWEKLSLDVKRKIESTWRPIVQAVAAKKSPNPQGKMYCLAMFPYPSGNLHIGHARVYAISDTMAHFHRMNGKYVIHPMGWDSFGLPAENAARTHKVDAREWTVGNVSRMREQLDNMGFCFDWDREVSTCEPEYYKGSQQIFLELFKRGLAYRGKSTVNWDPVDETVLADEQVDQNGFSWRSGAKVERKELTQWFVKTTIFSERLFSGLESPQLEDWENVIKIQKHWIGKCDGYFVDAETQSGEKLKIWTSSPEDAGLFVAVRRTHPLCSERKIVKDCFLDTNVVHPLHKNILPVIIFDRNEFKKDDVAYLGVASSEEDREIAFSLGLSTPPSTNMSKEEAIKTIKERGLGDGVPVSHHLRDWLVSRQRRWGTPIPIVLCPSCGPQPVPEEELPVLVPPSNMDLNTWKQKSCPKCGGAAERETDTLDTFVDSSWYFLRFLDPKNCEKPFDPAKVNAMMPVDLYVGGLEHAELHLYYARFMGHFLHSIGWLDRPEPFSRLLMQGMIMGKSYRVKNSGKYLRADQVDTSGKEPVEFGTGAAIVETWEKMSKSKLNGVSPEEVVQELGCDATRLAILVQVAPTSHRKWSSETYKGIINWQKKIWISMNDFLEQRKRQDVPMSDELSAELAKEEERLWDARNYCLSSTTYHMSKIELHLAILGMQGLTNSLRRTPKKLITLSTQFQRALALQLILIAPFAPHFASELWAVLALATSIKTNEFDWSKSVLEQRWPKLDAEYKLDLFIYLNDKEVVTFKLTQEEFRNIKESEVLELALGNDRFKNLLGSWEVKKILMYTHQDYYIKAFITSIRTDKDCAAGKQTKELGSDNENKEAKRNL